MFIKKGQLKNKFKKSNPILENPEGRSFEVSQISFYIWDRIDKKISREELAQYVSKKTKSRKAKIEGLINETINGLQRRGFLEII